MGWRQWLDRRKEQAQKMASRAPSPEVLAERLARACAEGLEDEARKLLSMGAGHGEWAGQPAWKWAADKAPGVFVEVAAKAPAARYEESPLHWAIENGRVDAVQALAVSFPDVDDDNLLRALRDAAQLGRVECAQWLVRFAPKLRAVHVVEWAIDSGSPECVNAVMLALRDHWGSSVFCDEAFDVLACESIRSGADWTQDLSFMVQPERDWHAGSLDMLQTVSRHASGTAMPRALRKLAVGASALCEEDILEGARILATPKTIAAWLANDPESVVGAALAERNLELARLLTERGANIASDETMLALAFSGADAACAAWALDVDRQRTEGLSSRCMRALEAMPSWAGAEMEAVAFEAAKFCEPRDLAQVAVAAVAAGKQALAKALLPLCDMGEVGSLALGRLGKAKDAAFGEAACAMARALTQRQMFAQAGAGAVASSKPARL